MWLDYAPRERDKSYTMKKTFVLVLAVFFIALVGIYSRPSGNLADLWPANSLILGLMLRNPQLLKSGFWLWSGLMDEIDAVIWCTHATQA